MKKFLLFFIAVCISYSSVGQCVAQFSNDTILSCGRQTSINLQLPWRSITGSVTSHLNDSYFTSESEGYIVGVNGIILKTINKGETFSALTSGTTETLNSVFLKSVSSGFCVGNNGTILATTNGGQTWSNQNIPNLTASINSIFFVNSLTGYLAGSDGCLYKTINGGFSWANVAPSGNSSDVYNGIYFTDENNGVVVGNNGKVLKTISGGDVWYTISNLANNQLTEVHFVNANKGYITGGSQIYQTNDGGYSWNSFASYPTFYHDIKFQNANVGYAVGYYGTIMKTTDGGTTWIRELTCITNEMNSVSVLDSFIIAVGKNGVIQKYEIPQQIVWNPNYSIDLSNPLNPIVYPFSTTNYKVNIAFENTPDFADSVLVNVAPFDFSAISDQSLFCGNTIPLTTETEWFPLYFRNNNNYRDLYFFNADTGFVITDEGRILKTNNSGYQWDSIAQYNFPLSSIDFVTDQFGVIVGSNKFLKTTNGGTTWTQTTVVAPGYMQAVHFRNSNLGFVCGGAMDISTYTAIILKTTDGGTNWDLKHLASGYILNDLYFVSDSIGFAVGSNGVILKTTDAGEQWTLISSGNTNHLNAITFTNPNCGFIAGSGIVLKTTTGGSSWSVCPGYFNYSYMSSLCFLDSLTGYIAGTGTNSIHVFQTKDGGLNWTTKTVPNLMYIPTSIVFPTKKSGYLVGGYGTFAKLEIPEETWAPANYVFQNSLGNYIAHPPQTTAFQVTATNRMGCSATDQVNIQVYPFFANYDHDHTISCGSNVLLNMISNGYSGTDPLNIRWYPNSYISDTTIMSPLVSPLNSQQYHIQITTSNGCSFHDSVMVTVSPLHINAGNDQYINCGETVQLEVGSIWTPVNAMYHYYYDISFPTESTGYGATNGIWKTTDGGYTWEVKLQSDPVRKLFFVDSLHGVAVGYGGLFVKTIDGNNFTIPSYLYNTEPRDLHFFNMDTGYVVCDGGKIRKTIDGGINWSVLTSGTTQNLNSVYFVSPQLGFIAGDNGIILKTTNYGQQWSTLNCGSNSNMRTVYFINENIGFVINDLHQAYKTTNGGTSWTLLPQNLPNNSLYFINEQVGYATGSLGATGAIAKTTNGGNTWQVTPYYNYSNFFGLSFPTPNVGYVFGAGMPQNSILKLPQVTDQIVWTPSLGLNDSTIYNPVATPTQTVTYHVSTLAGYCPAHDSITVYVNPLEIQTIHYNTLENICKASVVIDSISTNNWGTAELNYMWTLNGNISNTSIENPTITTDTSSWFIVTISTLNGCTDRDSIFIAVNPLMIQAGLDKYLHCGEITQLDSIVSNYSGPLMITYQWTPFSGLSDSTSPNPIVIPTNQIYTVTASIDTLCSAIDQVGVYFLTMEEPTICIVTVDTNNKNVIVFEKPVSNAIDSFFVYRETNVTGSYEKIGALSYDAISVFVDQTSSPIVNSNQYKLSLIDTCGFPSNMSTSHKTMHLTINQGMGNTWNLIWQPYEGFIVNTYNIYRGTSPSQMQLLGTISGANTQYTDLNPPSGYVYYQVEVVAPYSCIPRSKSGYQSSRSNIASNATIAVEDFANNGSFQIYPNPTREVIHVDFQWSSLENQLFLVYNVLGEQVLKGTLSRDIDVSTLINGVYLFQVEYNGRFIQNKFVIQK